MFQFGGFNMFPDIPRPFNTQYRCFSVSMLPGNERQDVERGGKIIMPPSALEQLTRLNINYPMLFKLSNSKTSRITHCGVLEFVADEGRVYLPHWMMHNLLLEEGDIVQIESVSLPVATFSRFQPQSADFLDISNPKAVLENGLRNFACLTTEDMIAIKYNQKIYELRVLETKPGNAVSIIECDMNIQMICFSAIHTCGFVGNSMYQILRWYPVPYDVLKVEFAAPVDYKEPERPKQADEAMNVDFDNMMPEPVGFVAFRGEGKRLDGKRRKESNNSDPTPMKQAYMRGIPDYDYEIGSLKFLRNSKPKIDIPEIQEEFKPFSGTAHTMHKKSNG